MSQTIYAKGSPTKEFFVGMLTRDIELEDAILDLLDNCLDGVVRSKKNKNKLDDPEYYKGFYANIIITQDKFIIEDNCGGIPKETAIKYAFRMGRSEEETATDGNDPLPTVGIYGIGMKRAIFKIGRSAHVYTKFNEEKYTVEIPKDWASVDGWDFPLIENDPNNSLDFCGTRIEIYDINEGISDRWRLLDTFCEELITAVQNSYSLIIQKGFKIKINDRVVESLPVELLAQLDDSPTGIRPYIFKQQYDDVIVKLAIGFYAPPPSEIELDEISDNRRSTQDAGITIVCNDRVVLYNDKSSLTGWGTSGVPNYHTQFIGIRGIVIFESTNPKSLPMTTTKRGIDHSSPIYLAVKDRICDGLKLFTNYTNKWKGQNQGERKFSTQAKKISYSTLFQEDEVKKYGITLRSSQKGRTFNPQLPSPPSDKPYKVIRFTRWSEDISAVSEYLFHESDFEPSKVGEKCFDIILENAKKNED